MLDFAELYGCNVCGNTMSGNEWDDNTDPKGDYKYQCPGCGHNFNEEDLEEG